VLVIARSVAYLRDNRTMKSLQLLPKADVIEGAVRALAVLEAFSAERQRLNATQVAERAGITRAAARRHLLTLQALGYLEGEGGVYWLGVRVLRLAGNYLASARLPRVVQPTLNRLSATLDCAVSVAVLDDADVVIVARSGEQRMLRRALPFGTHLGARLPAFATSTGRILLAQLSRAQLSIWLEDKVLQRLTPHTTTGRIAWKACVQRAAQQGYCVANQEHELGVQALAVPLRDSSGRVVAALNVVVSADGDVMQLAKSKNAQKTSLTTHTSSLVPPYLPAMLAAADEVRLLL
jgi:IclR family transcriptional regulator, pca regulon regulatory protein